MAKSMKGRGNAAVRVGLVLVVVAVVLAPMVARAASLGEKLPSEAHVAFWIDSVAEARAEATTNPYFNWLTDEKKGIGSGGRAIAGTFKRIPISPADPMYPIWSMLLPWMNRAMQAGHSSANSVFNFDAGEISDTFSGSVAVYSTMYDLFVQNKTDIVEWDVIFTGEFKADERAKVEEFLKKSLARVPADARKKKVDYSGEEIYHLEYYLEEEAAIPGDKKKNNSLGVVEEIPVIVEYGFVGNYLLMAEGRGEPLKKAVRSLKEGGDQFLLHKKSGFRASQASLGGEGAQFHLYFDVGRHAAELASEPAYSEETKLLGALGLDSAGPVLASCAINEKGIEVRATLVTENEPKGVLKVLADSPQDQFNLLTVVPRDSESFGSISLDFYQAYLRFRAAMRATNPAQVQLLDATMASLKASSNLDVEKDILQKCAGEMVTYIRSQGSSEDGSAPGAAFVFPISGGTETVTAVNGLVRKLNSEDTKILDLEETDYQGNTVWETPETADGGPGASGIYFSPTAKGFALANSGAELRDLLRRLSGEASSSVGERDEVSAFLRDLPRDGVRGFFYTFSSSLATDWDRMIRNARDQRDRDALPFESKSEFERTVGDTWWTLHARDRGLLFTYRIEAPGKSN